MYRLVCGIMSAHLVWFDLDLIWTKTKQNKTKNWQDDKRIVIEHNQTNRHSHVLLINAIVDANVGLSMCNSISSNHYVEVDKW